MRGLITKLLAVTVLTGLAGCERWALDRQMEELCKKDGGVRVYEKVTLPPAEFDALKKYVTTAKSTEDYYGPKFRYVSTRDILVGKNAKAGAAEGQLVRLYWAIYRRSDGHLLGEQVEYRRSGGDLFTFGFQPSSASCPFVDRDVAQMVFFKGE